MSLYIYGMRMRGCSPGAQPKDGFKYFSPSDDRRYYDKLYYTRKLTDEELKCYELDYIMTVDDSDKY